MLILNYYFLVHFSSSLIIHNRTVEIQWNFQCDEERKMCECSTSRSIRMRNKRIIGGERVIDEKTWPWMVSLRLGGHHICGGAIISAQFIVTAAHCITNGTLTAAFSLIQQSNLTRNDSRIVSINGIYLHPAWNSHTMENDLALIRFEHRSEISIIKCLCLPSAFEIVQLQSEVIVIGFGRDRPSRIRSSNYLHQIKLRVLPLTSVSCQNEITDNKTQICAGLEVPDKGTNEKRFAMSTNFFCSSRYVSRWQWWTSDVLFSTNKTISFDRYCQSWNWLWPCESFRRLHACFSLCRLDSIHSDV